jgi:integrase
MADVRKEWIVAFRNETASRVSAKTANHHLKALRMVFGDAKRDGYTFDDPTEGVDTVKEQNTSKRRPFSLDELRTVLAIADDEWRGMILFGFYTGQRLGDIARMTWQNIDTERGQVRFVTAKTGRSQILPMHARLVDYVSGLESSEHPHAPIFPRAAAAIERTGGTVGPLSHQFANLLAQAGLRAPVSHKAKRRSTGEAGGRDRRRDESPLSFHSLRHTATSLMKAANVPASVVMDFIGHDDKVMSRHYTHTGDAALRQAADALPDLVAQQS